jgi:hypothetical protein
VAASTGNTTIAGTLGATGDFSVNTSKFNVVASSGNTTVAGTLGTTGDFAVNTSKFNVTATSGNTAIAGDLSVNATKFNVTATTGDTSVAGTLGVTGLSTLSGGASIVGDASVSSRLSVGTKHLLDQKTTVTGFGVNTSVLAITFANLTGSSPSLLKKGALLKLDCYLSGFNSTSSINLYQGVLWIAPGAAGGNACTLSAISQTSTNIIGTATTMTAGISGTGTNATVNLTLSKGMGDSNAIIFYEVGLWKVLAIWSPAHSWVLCKEQL